MACYDLTRSLIVILCCGCHLQSLAIFHIVRPLFRNPTPLMKKVFDSLTILSRRKYSVTSRPFCFQCTKCCSRKNNFNRVPARPVVSSRVSPLDDVETEAAVLANFDFLQNDVEDEEDNDDELDDGGSADDESEDRDDMRLGRRLGKRAKPGNLSTIVVS